MKNEAMQIDEKTGIVYRKWQSCSPKAIFLLVHGLGAYSGRWDALARFFLERDISSYAIDLQGFGHTKDLKGHVDSFQTYFQDIQSLCDIIRIEHKKEKIFLIGESMGALIAFLTMALKGQSSDGLICISPVFKSRLKFSLWGYIKFFSSLIVNSKKQIILPFDAKMCTRDLDFQEVLEKDTKEHRLATSKLLFNILLAQMRARLVKDKIEIPILFLVSGKDEIADSKVTENVFEGLVSQDKKIVCYPQMRHALSIELGREKVFEDMLRWVEERV